MRKGTLVLSVAIFLTFALFGFTTVGKAAEGETILFEDCSPRGSQHGRHL